MTEDLNITTEPVEPEPEPAPAVVEADPRFAVAPQERRFLFVDIAALRAKQLRRGALNRLNRTPGDAAIPVPRKAERIAMEEVRRGYVQYELPGAHSDQTPGEEQS